MNLENQSAILEDIGQQVLANGEWARPEMYMEKIHAIKAEDIQRIARQMLRSKPTVAAFGDLNNLPDYQSIESALTNTEGKLPNTGKE
jgi:processing peptidase subunit alpha